MASGVRAIPAAAAVAEARWALAAGAARAAADYVSWRGVPVCGVGAAAAGHRMLSVVSRIHYINSRTRMQSLLHATELLPPLLLQPAPCRSPLLAYHHRWRTRRARSRSKFHPHPLPLPLPAVAPLAAPAACNLPALAAPALAAATGQQPLQPEVLPQLVRLPAQQQQHHDGVQQQQQFFSVHCGVGAAGEYGELAALPPPLLVAPEHLLSVAKAALQAELDEAAAVVAVHPFASPAAAARFSAASAVSHLSAAATDSPPVSTSAAVSAASAAAARCAEEVAAAAAAAAQGGSRAFWQAMLQRIQEVRDLLPIDVLVKLLAIVATRFSPHFSPLCSSPLKPFEDTQHTAAGLVKLLLPRAAASSSSFTSEAAASEAEAAAAAASPSAALLLPCMRPLPPPLLLACTRDLLEDLTLMSPPAAAAVAAAFASSNCCSSSLLFALIERWRWTSAAAAAAARAAIGTPAAAAASALAAELLQEEQQGSTSSISTRSSAAAGAGQQQMIQQQQRQQRNGTAERGLAAAAAAPNRHADLNTFSATDFSVFISSLSHVLLQRQEIQQRQQRQLRHRLPPPPSRPRSAGPLLPRNMRFTPSQQQQLQQHSNEKQQQAGGKREAAGGASSRGSATPIAKERSGVLAASFFRDCCCFLHAKRKEFTLRSFAAAVAALAAALPHKPHMAGITAHTENLQQQQQQRQQQPPWERQQQQQPQQAVVKNSPSLASVRILLLTADAFLKDLHARGALFATVEQPRHADSSSRSGGSEGGSTNTSRSSSSSQGSSSNITEVVTAATRAEELLTAARLLHALAVCRRYLHDREYSVEESKHVLTAGGTGAAEPAAVDKASFSRFAGTAPEAHKAGASSDAAVAEVNDDPGLAGCALLAASLPQLLLQLHQQVQLLPLPTCATYVLQRPGRPATPQQQAHADEEGTPIASHAGLRAPRTAAAAATAAATQPIDQAAVQLRNQLLAAGGLAAAAAVKLSALTPKGFPAAAGAAAQQRQGSAREQQQEQQQQQQQSAAEAQLLQEAIEGMQHALSELLRTRGALGMQTDHLVDCLELLATSGGVISSSEASVPQKKASHRVNSAAESAAGSAAVASPASSSAAAAAPQEKRSKSQLSLFCAPDAIDAERHPLLCAALEALAAELVRRYAALNIYDKARLKYFVKRLRWEDPFLKHCLGSYTVAIARWRPSDAAAVAAIDALTAATATA